MGYASTQLPGVKPVTPPSGQHSKHSKIEPYSTTQPGVFFGGGIRTKEVTRSYCETYKYEEASYFLIWKGIQENNGTANSVWTWLAQGSVCLSPIHPSVIIDGGTRTKVGTCSYYASFE
jgi:hypothetical protein